MVFWLRLSCGKDGSYCRLYINLIKPMILFDGSTCIDFPCNVEFETFPVKRPRIEFTAVSGYNL